MDWDALAALAAGGEAYLGKKDMLRKEELAQKLENDKIEKAHQWEIDSENRKEARIMNTPSDKVEYFDRDGVTFKRIYGGRNNILDEVPASPDEIKARANAQQKESLTLRVLENNAKKGDLDLQYADEDHVLDTQRDRASLEETIARTGSYNRANTPEARGLTGSDVDQSPGALTNKLIAEFPDLQKEYTEGDNASMSKQDFRDIAQEVIIRAAKRGVDPRIAFSEALKRYKKSPTE